MKQTLSNKLLIGDFYQYFTYPIRKKIVSLYKEGNILLLEQILTGLIKDEEQLEFSEDIQVVTIFDAHYPPLLLESYDPPLVLYCKGDIDLLLKTKKVALVGSRTPQGYSLEATQKIVEHLHDSRDEELVIVSGLAKGIDGYSHRYALDNNIATIAVLAFGFHYMYPKENKQLAEEIAEKGLLISEYPPHIGVHKWQFVARNRIISGLCRAVIIVEAKERSGSLITAELALSENREVFIVSGKAFDTSYYGSHALIQEGAKILLSVEEVIAEYTTES